MNDKKLKDLYDKGLITTENREIDNLTIRCNGHWMTSEFLISFKPKNKESEWRYQIKLPIKRIIDFASIFCNDSYPEYESNWNLNEYIGKYVRLIWYNTPKEEMHELADEQQLVGITHITENTNVFYIEPDKKGQSK